MNFNFPAFLVLATLLTGGIWLIDALFFARKRANRLPEPGAKRTEPLLVEYSKSFFPVILVVLLLRSFVVEPFRIPSGSMMPTLLVGDFILVNKFTYGIRLPVLNNKVIENNEPKTGDVVVFRYPQNPSLDYIKRVIGTPGDKIYYQNKTVFVNDVPQKQTPIEIYTGVGSGARETGVLRNSENLEGVVHDVLVNPMVPDFGYGCQVLGKGPIVVPENHYFVMGDNRDNSNDSRCWGLVPEENLVGKAFGIWMNWDGNKDGLPISWERIGHGID